jgi:hypothetical protein
VSSVRPPAEPGGGGAFLGAMALNYGVAGALFIGTLVVWTALTAPDVPVVPLLLTGLGVHGGVDPLLLPFLEDALGGHRSPPSQDGSLGPSPVRGATQGRQRLRSGTLTASRGIVRAPLWVLAF